MKNSKALLSFLLFLVTHSVEGQDQNEFVAISFPGSSSITSNIDESIDRSSTNLRSQELRENLQTSHRDHVKKVAPNCIKYSTEASLCEEDTEYDVDIQHLFEKALKNSNLNSLVHNNLISKMLIDVDEKQRTISNRFGEPTVFDDPLCPSFDNVIYPKRGMTRSNDWVYILNQNEIQQGIKVEQCTNSSTSNLAKSVQQPICSQLELVGETSECRQKYIYRNMLTMDETGLEILTESILVPSCCVCRRLKQFPPVKRSLNDDSSSSSENSETAIDDRTNPIEEPVEFRNSVLAKILF